MPTDVETDLPARPPGRDDLDFLVHWNRPEPRRTLVSVIGSLAAHALALAAAVLIGFGPAKDPGDILRSSRIEDRASVTLVTPPDIIRPTQREPNTVKPQSEVDLAALIARPDPIPSPAIDRPPAPQKGLPVPPRQQPPAPESPKIEAPPQIAQGPPPALGNVNAPNPPPIQPPPPARPPEAKPKLAFESIGAQTGAPKQTGQIVSAKSSLEETVKSAIKRTGGGIVVGDLGEPGVSGMPSPTSTPSRQSSLELMSDPEGADFKPYLTRVLAVVRRNWFAVMPESARMGQRGRSTIQFVVNRDGSVPKLVISGPSGSDALDRAAVAGISASNPLPPLPAEFKGARVQLQLSFSYNMPSQR